MTTKSWRDVLPIHPAAELFPLMAPDELKALGEDIRKNGLASPIGIVTTKDATGWHYQLVDGRNRLDAMELVGVPFELMLRHGDCVFVYGGEKLLKPKVIDSDPYEYVISANIRRRHLTAEQRYDLIANLLAANPNKSDRQIAKTVKASPTFVGKVRAEKEATGDVSTVDTRTDTKGRQQPAKRTPTEYRPDIDERCRAVFENDAQYDAFCAAVSTESAKRYISKDQQLAVAKQIAANKPYTKAYVSMIVRDAAMAQHKIDEKEEQRLHGEQPGLEIKAKVKAAEAAARALIAPLLRLEELAGTYTGHPFFGSIGSTLETVVRAIRQYGRASGDIGPDSPGEIERLRVRGEELRNEKRNLEHINLALKSEIEELKAALAKRAPPADDGLDIPENLRRAAP